MEEFQLRLSKAEIANQCQQVLLADDALEQYFQRMGQLRQQLQEATRSNSTPFRVSQILNQFPTTQNIWRDIYSFLTAATHISNLLWPLGQDIRSNSRDAQYAEFLRKHLDIEDNSPLNPFLIPSIRAMRNNFEHYDARLEEFAQQGKIYIDSNIGPVGAFSVPGQDDTSGVPQRHFDQEQWAVIFQNHTLPLRPIVAAVHSLAQKVQIL